MTFLQLSGGLPELRSVVTLSEWLRLTIRRNGQVRILFRLGVPVAPGYHRKTESAAREVHFRQQDIFVIEILRHIAKRLRDHFFLNNALKLSGDQRHGKEENFAFAGGVQSLSSTSMHQVGTPPHYFLPTGEETISWWSFDAVGTTVISEQVYVLQSIPKRMVVQPHGLRAAMTRTLPLY